MTKWCGICRRRSRAGRDAISRHDQSSIEAAGGFGRGGVPEGKTVEREAVVDGGVAGFGGAGVSTNGQPGGRRGALGRRLNPARITAGMGGRRAAVYTDCRRCWKIWLCGLAKRSVGDRKLPSHYGDCRGILSSDAERHRSRSWPRLEKIISKAIQQPCIIKIAETPSDVYVLRGQWKFKALDNNDGTQILHLFGKDMSNERGTGNGMLPSKMFAMGGIGRFIHAGGDGCQRRSANDFLHDTL